MRVQVSEYNPVWPKHFDAIKQELELVLANVPYKSIEHVGSTSVPGLAAKPTIDIDIIVTEGQVKPIIEALTNSGKYYCPGDLGIPDRYAIRSHDQALYPTRNIYVCVDGCQSLRNHLALRDTCRASDEIRDKYAQLKLDLSGREWKDVDEYCQAKTEILTWILSRSGFGKEELDQIALANGVRL